MKSGFPRNRKKLDDHYLMNCYLRGSGSYGLTIVTGCVGKTSYASDLLTQGKVDYAIDVDVMINMISKTFKIRMWSDTLLEIASYKLCAHILNKIIYVSKLRQFSVAFAIDPVSAQDIDLLDLIETKPVTLNVVNAGIEAKDLKAIWNKRYKDTGNWKQKASMSIEDIEDYITLREKAIRALSFSGVGWNYTTSGDIVVRVIPFESDDVEHDSKYHYGICEKSFNLLLKHLNESGDFSNSE